MSNRNRKLFIALGIAALILAVFFGWSLSSFWGYQKEHAQKRDDISAYQAETSEQYPDVCFREGDSVMSLLKCLVKTVDSNRNAQRTQYDLQAQQEMAEWAYALFLLTAAGFFASIVGLVALYNSLGLSRRALLIATRGNRNTIRAINQEQRNAQRQLRAYVYVSETKLFWNSDNSTIEAELTFKNFGQTPAKSARAKIKLDLIATGKESETFAGPIDEIRPSMDIAPSQHKTISATVVNGIPASDVKRVKENAAAIYLWGVVEYFDVFGQKQTTAFRRMSDKFPPENLFAMEVVPIKFFMCDEGNDAT